MRIVLVCPYAIDRPGGVQQHVLEWANHLLRMGHEVLLIAPGTLPAGFTHISHVNAGAFRMVSLFGTRFEISWPGRTLRKYLRSHIRAFSPDLIHFHAVWVPFMPLLLRAGLNFPTLCTFHDTPKNGLQQPFLRAAMQIASATLSFFFDAFISVSAVQRKNLNCGRFDSIPIIPNGIDLTRFRRPGGRVKTPGQVLLLGRLEPRKGGREALEAFRRVYAKKPEIRLIIAGDGPMRPALEKAAETLPANVVHFTGMLREEEKIRLLQESAVVVTPALYGESFGIVLLEAMAAGTPVCGFGNEGYAMLAGRYDAGLFPAPGDVAGLARAMESLLSDPLLIRTSCEAGQLLAASFSWNVLAPALLAMYESVLSGHKKR